MEEQFLLKKQALSTGIEDLDIILNGGFEKASSIAILGPVGFEKALFGLYFMSTKNTRNFYITFDMSPKQIVQKASNYSIELNVEKFIDGYSKQAGVAEEGHEVMSIDGPTALNDISLNISTILHEIKQWQTPKFFFHSFSTMLLYNPVDSVMKFFQVIEGRVKEKEGGLMILLEKGLHKQGDLNLILRSCDYVLDIDKNAVWKLKTSFLNFDIEFSVDANGINII